MAVVRVLEAYYGCGVVLDYQDQPGRAAALELGLRTIRKMEPAQPLEYAVRLQTHGGEDVEEWRSRQTHGQVLEFLFAHVAPEYRFYRVLCRMGEGRPYVFRVLSEDGSCVDLAPAWQAGHEWFDEFWAAMWKAGEELEQELPAFRLEGRPSCSSDR